MPSGSHGGSRGSHGGGGASFGGGGRGSYRMGGYRRVPRRRIYFIGGRRYFLSSRWNSRFSALSTIASFSIFFLITAIMVLCVGISSKNDIATDYYYYQDMIADAEANPELIVEGEITDKFLNEDCGKWYYTYEFVADNGSVVEGYTYSVYTREEIRKFTIGDTILLAVNMIDTNQKTDSIPMDYKDIPLSNDGEYANAQKFYTIGLVGTIVIGAVIIGVAISMFVIVSKHKQLATDEVIENETSATRYCAYCGAMLAEDEANCRHCGAGKRN